MDRDAALLRRYVISRSSGQYPRSEYARKVGIGGIGVWLRCDERAARAADRWRRVRIPGRPWCPVLGNRLDITQDVELQSYFATVPDSDWYGLELDVRRHPHRCLAGWRAAGRRLIVAAQVVVAGHRVPSKLSGWPLKRGSGPRSLVPER